MGKRIRASKREEDRLDAVLAALADRTRRAIISRLVEGEARVTDVAEPFGMSLNAVSKHIRVLERTGILRRRIEGRDHLLSVDLDALAEVDQWIDRTRTFWTARIDSLEQLLKQRKKR